MGNMYSGTSNKDLFLFLVKEQKCSDRRKVCGKDCVNCSLYTSNSHVIYEELLEMLRTKDPTLYFSSEIVELEKLLTKEIKDGSQD